MPTTVVNTSTMQTTRPFPGPHGIQANINARNQQQSLNNQLKGGAIVTNRIPGSGDGTNTDATHVQGKILTAQNQSNAYSIYDSKVTQKAGSKRQKHKSRKQKKLRKSRKSRKYRKSRKFKLSY